VKLLSGIPVLLVLVLGNSAFADDATENSNAPPPPSLLDSSEKLLKSYVLGRKVNLGAGFAQGTFKLWRTGEKAQLTDNGGISLLASVDSRTRPLKTWPMRHGEASLGYDFTATGSFFSASKQLLDSATQGEDIGTSVNGGFVAAAPRLTVYMGPLYEGGHIFWKYSAGAGAALLHFNGNALFEGDQSTGLHSVGGSVVPSLYVETKWQMQFGHWDVIFNSQYLGTRNKGYFTTYEVYGVGAAYQFSF
jgi:hypothetical protein